MFDRWSVFGYLHVFGGEYLSILSRIHRNQSITNLTNKLKILHLSFRLFKPLQCYKILFYKVMILLSWNLHRTRKLCGLTLDQVKLCLLHQLLILYMYQDFFFVDKNRFYITFSRTNSNRKRGEHFCSGLQQWSNYLKIWIYANWYIHVQY